MNVNTTLHPSFIETECKSWFLNEEKISLVLIAPIVQIYYIGAN